MKKLLLILGMITCILGLTACGKTDKAEQLDVGVSNQFITEEQAPALVDGFLVSMNQICEAGEVSQYASDPFASAALASWESAREVMGSYVQVIDATVEIDGQDAIVKAVIQGETRNVEVILSLNETAGITSVTANPIFSFGEMMEKAALNTVIGMGTVFTVLILISIIISCFGFIPKIQNALSKKKNIDNRLEEKPTEVFTAVDNTIAQIIEKEELTDDLELVAVIAAAIAASKGATSTEGFVVRSIRKAKRTF